MVCAYSKCVKPFEPSRKGQRYHRGRCRELAKAEKFVVVKIPRDNSAIVQRLLKRLAADRRGVTPHPGSEPRRFRQAALWFRNRIAELRARQPRVSRGW